MIDSTVLVIPLWVYLGGQGKDCLEMQLEGGERGVNVGWWRKGDPRSEEADGSEARPLREHSK